MMDRRRFLAAGLGICGFALPGALRAEEHPYEVTPEAGPWLIFVKSYSGPPARQLSIDLISEIRTRYKYPAYFFNKGAEERDKEQERVNRLLRQQEEFLKKMGLPPAARSGVKTFLRVEEQYAVLVGGWNTMEDARQALDGIRKLDPPSKKLMDVARVTTPGENPGEQGTPGKQELMYVSPFISAFVVPNPTIERSSEDSTSRLDNDPVIAKLNSAEEYSLLKCPKPWTLAVRVYNAPTVIQPQEQRDTGFLSKLGLGNKSQEVLDHYAQQAHAVAALLRAQPKNPLEAYVLHTQYSSIVCVGGYDSPKDPLLLTNQRMLAGKPITESTQQGVPTGRILDTLSNNPLPMPVPKMSR